VPSSSASVTPTKILVHPETLRPFGHLKARKKEGSTKRKKENLRYTLTHLLKKGWKKKSTVRERGRKPATKRLIKFQKKNKIPEPDSSSEDEIDLDETTLCDDSSDELSDVESYVQTSLSLDNIEADDHILVALESELTAPYYVGRVLQVTEKVIRSTFMRKNVVINLEVCSFIFLKSLIFAFTY